MKPHPHTICPKVGHEHTHTLIFLHGRDSTALDFHNELFESEASEPAGQPRTLDALFPTIRWVFPTAPVTRSARFGTEMSQWFDMWSVESPDEKAEGQMDGLAESIDILQSVIKGEEYYVKRNKIFLAGISQGFATALAAFLYDGARPGLAGLIGLSSWMPPCGRSISKDGQTSTPNTGPNTMRPTPILLCHSADDEVVPVENGRNLRVTLKDSFPRRFEVEWHEFKDGGHWVNEPLGVDVIVEFMRRHM